MHDRRRRPGVATALVALGVSLIISISGIRWENVIEVGERIVVRA